MGVPVVLEKPVDRPRPQRLTVVVHGQQRHRGQPQQQIRDRAAREHALKCGLAAREQVRVAIGTIRAELPSRLQMMTALLERERIREVDRARAARDRKIGIVAERFIAGKDERRISLIAAGQRRTVDSERRELIRARALREVFTSQRIHPESEFVHHARRQRLREPRADVVPLVEHRHAEPWKVARAHRKRQGPIIAAEAVPHGQRIVVPQPESVAEDSLAVHYAEQMRVNSQIAWGSWPFTSLNNGTVRL